MDLVKTEPEEVDVGDTPVYVVDLYMDIVKEDTEVSPPRDNVENMTIQLKSELHREDDDDDHDHDVDEHDADDQEKDQNSQDDITYRMIGPPKVCSKCNKSWQPELVQHKCHVNDDLPYKCSICPEKFKFKQKLKEHEKSHLDSWNFKICLECGSTCKNVYFLMKHMRQHKHDKSKSINFKCNYCGDKSFKRKSQLESHMRLEHQCSVCRAVFDSKDKVKLHERCHLKRSLSPTEDIDCERSAIRKSAITRRNRHNSKNSHMKSLAKTSVVSSTSQAKPRLKVSQQAAESTSSISCTPCRVNLINVSKSNKSAMEINRLVSAVKAIVIQNRAMRSVGRDYNIDKSKLSRYISKLNEAHLDPSTATDEELAEFLTVISGKTGGKTILSADQEKVLMIYLMKASEIYYGLSRNELRTMAYEFTKKLGVAYPGAWDVNQIASYDWYYGFIHRHPNLVLRTPEQISANREKGFTAASASAFFANLSAVLDEQVFEPHRIWNVDEVGCPTVTSEKSASRRTKKQRTSDEEGRNVSLAFAVSATGQSIPPFYIFPQKTMEKNFMDNTTPGSVGVANESGWMTAIEFIKFMSHFIKYANAAKSSPILLLLDNHTSHLSVEAIDMALDHGITMVSFPPHCSHRMQPLDVSVFGPFKAMFHHQCQVWIKNHNGQPLEIEHLPHIADKCLDAAATPKNIKFGFRATGIVPFDPNVFTPEDFLAATLSGENQCPDDHPDDCRTIMINSNATDATAHVEAAIPAEPCTSNASTHSSLLEEMIVRIPSGKRKAMGQTQAEEKDEQEQNTGQRLRPKRRCRVEVIQISSDSDEDDVCIICKKQLPVKLNDNNCIHCNVCDRAVHFKCVNLEAAHFTCVHCESD